MRGLKFLMAALMATASVDAAAQVFDMGALTNTLAKTAPPTNAAGVPTAPPTPQKAVVSADKLNYTMSPAVRKETEKMYVDRARGVNPELASQLEQMFGQMDIWTLLDQELGKNNLKLTSVPDIMGVWLLSMLQVEAGDTSELSPAQYKGASTMMASSMLATPQFADLTDADKQKMCEGMLLDAVFLSMALGSAQTPQEKSNLANMARSQTKELGFDLAKFKITPQGIGKR